MLTGRKITLLDRTLIRQAALPLEKELGSLAPAEPTNGVSISGQTNLQFEA
jgi:hypothetical protein